MWKNYEKFGSPVAGFHDNIADSEDTETTFKLIGGLGAVEKANKFKEIFLNFSTKWETKIIYKI